VHLTDGEFMTKINSKLLAVNGLEPHSAAVEETLKFSRDPRRALHGLDEEWPVGLVGLQRLHWVNSLYLYNKDRRIGG
jgi:hypothetical protein